MSRPDRKKKFVDTQVQGSLVRRLVMHWAAFFVAASLVAFALQVFSNPFRSFGEHFQSLWWTHGPFLMVILFMLPLFIVDSIKFSHRFAGPIFRLRRTIRKIAAGDSVPRLKLRDYDFWQGLAEDFNIMIERLDSQSTKRSDEQQPDTKPFEIK